MRSTSGCTWCRVPRPWPTPATATPSASIPDTRQLRNVTQDKTYTPVPLSAKEEEIRRSGGIFAVGRREFADSVRRRPALDWAPPELAERMTTTEQIVWAHRVDKDLRAAGASARA